MSDNGKAPFAFKAGLPIIGQAFTIKAWYLSLVGMCNCDHPEPVQIVGQFGSALGQCPGCKKLWTVKTMRHDPVRGTLEFEIGLVQMHTQAESPAPAAMQ